MDKIILALVPIVEGISFFGIIQMLVKQPGSTLNRNFASLGILEGKTLEEITTACGSPNAVSTLPDEKVLYQWQALGYHISLLFDENNICMGVTKYIL